MHRRSTGSSIASPRVLAAILLSLWLSEMASASPTRAEKTPMQRRATTARAAATGTTSAAAGKKGLSLIVIIVIIVVVVVALLLLGALLYFCYRKRAKARKNKALNMSTIGQQPSPRPLSGTARREADWWQPSDDTAHTVSSHTNVPYSQGGHGYTYGQTLDPASAGAMPGTRTSTYSRHAPPPSRGEGTEQPFQIPVMTPSPRPPSLSPSYHTYVAPGDMHVPTPPNPSGTGYTQTAAPPNTTQSATPHNPALTTNPHPGAFLHRQDTTLQYLQPQATGTSMYSSPYEVTAMTQSTSGHPGT